MNVLAFYFRMRERGQGQLRLSHPKRGQACRANVNHVLRHPPIGADMEYTPTAMSLLLLPTSIRNVQNCSARQTQISRPTGSSVLSGTRVPCNKFGFPVRIRIILTVLRTDRVAAVIGDVDVYVDVLAVVVDGLPSRTYLLLSTLWTLGVRSHLPHHASSFRCSHRWLPAHGGVAPVRGTQSGHSPRPQASSLPVLRCVTQHLPHEPQSNHFGHRVLSSNPEVCL